MLEYNNRNNNNINNNNNNNNNKTFMTYLEQQESKRTKLDCKSYKDFITFWDSLQAKVDTCELL